MSKERYRRGQFINAIIKETGNEVVLRKEPDGTIFQDMYSDYDGSHYYSEDEIKKIEKVDPIKIELTEKQTSEYNNFCREHAHPDFKAGGTHSLIITYHGIGIGVTAKCEFCKQTKDITDYDTW